MTEIEVLLKRVEEKATAMASQLKDLNKANQELRDKLVLMQKDLEDRESQISELKEQKEVLTIAKTLSKENNVPQSFQRIDELVKDIDKCLTLLHKQ